MTEFKEITIADREWMRPLMLAENCRNEDFCFGTVYAWLDSYPVQAAEIENRLVIKAAGHENVFYYPVGSGSIRPAIDRMLELARGQEKLSVFCLTEENKKLLEAEYPGCFAFSEAEEDAEYIYLAEKLSTYAGRALHGKRNHCNQFMAVHDWQFVPLTRSLIPACREMLAAWAAANAYRLGESISGEYTAIERVFDAYEALELDGGVLLAEGRVVGFSVGEMVSADTFLVHFEKADLNLNGAYPMVCREMTKLAMKKYPALVYMNREEDLGIDSLRYSKMSYHPEYLLKIYSAVRKKENYGNT